MKIFYFVSLSLIIANSGSAQEAARSAAKLWGEKCSECHGPDGRGDTPRGHKLHIINLSDAQAQASFKDVQIVKDIRYGKVDANGKTTMLPFEDFTADEVKGLIAYIRALPSKGKS